MKSGMMKIIVAGLAMASFCLMGCEPSEDAVGPVSITVKDADGNVYPTMKMGKQIWMAKNLNVKVDGSMCLNNDPANCEKCGRLYTWEAAKSACPVGWHLPSKDEFEIFLETFKAKVDQIIAQKQLNGEPLRKGEKVYAFHLMATDWSDVFPQGFDTFGFSALQAGNTNINKNHGTGFWSSSPSSYAAFILAIKYTRRDYFAYVENEPRTYGYSVRCLRDSK